MLKNSTPAMRLTVGRLMLLAAVVAVPMALAFGAKPPAATDKAPPTTGDSPTPALPARAETAGDTPRVEIDLDVVAVPRKLDLVRQLPGGGVILSEAQAKRLLEDHKADVLSSPRLVCNLGVDVCMKCNLGSRHLLAFQAVPETVKESGAVALRIKPIVTLGRLNSSEGAAELPRPKDWPTSINVELKPREAVVLGGWDDGEGKKNGKDLVTVFVVKARRHAEPAKSNENAVHQRAINRPVKDFPEKTDLSTPETAAAAFQRAIINPDPKLWLKLSAWKYGPEDVKRVKAETEGKMGSKDEIALMNNAYRNAEIVEVQTYRDGVAQVISKLKFPKGVGRDPYSLRTFVRINGSWKNFGEDRLPSVEAAEKRFDRVKHDLWKEYVEVLNGIKSGHPVTLPGGRPKRTAPIAPGQPLGISVEKADLMGRVEWAFMHGARDVTARKSLEWGDIHKDKNGNRTIRYKFEATIWGKKVLIANQIFTFDAKGNVLDVKDVEGYPKKKVEKPADVTTQSGMKELVEDFFSKNFRDVTSRETIEWGKVTKDSAGNSSIRYKYRATIWDKDVTIMNQVFTFDPKGKFVSVKEVKGFPQKQ